MVVLVFCHVRPHPAQALGGCNALPVSGGAVLVPGFVALAQGIAGKVYLMMMICHCAGGKSTDGSGYFPPILRFQAAQSLLALHGRLTQVRYRLGITCVVRLLLHCLPSVIWVGWASVCFVTFAGWVLLCLPERVFGCCLLSQHSTAQHAEPLLAHVQMVHACSLVSQHSTVGRCWHGCEWHSVAACCHSTAQHSMVGHNCWHM